MAQAEPVTTPGLAGWSVVGAETVHGRSVLDVQSGWPSTTFGYTMGAVPDHRHQLPPRPPLRLRGDHEQPVRPLLLCAAAVRAVPDPRLQAPLPRRSGSEALHDEQCPVRFPVPRRGGDGFPDPVRTSRSAWAPTSTMTLLVTGNFAPQFIFGPMVGPYVEYHPTPQFSLGLNTRFGAGDRRLLVLPGHPGRNEHLLRLHHPAVPGLPAPVAPHLADVRHGAGHRPGLPADPSFLDNRGGFR